MPILWAYFVRDAGQLTSVVRGLLENGILGEGLTSAASIVTFVRREVDAKNRRVRYVLLAFCATALIAAAEYVGFNGPGDRFLFGHRDHWWHLNAVYFWAVWMPLAFVNIYIDGSFFLRRTVAIGIINRTLTQGGVTPQLYHPDQSNGFSPIGAHAVGIAPLLALGGWWAFLVTFYPGFFHQSVVLGWDVAVFFAVYIIGIVVYLFWPVWTTHRIMAEAKAAHLNKIARQLRTLLDAAAHGEADLRGAGRTPRWWRRLFGGRVSNDLATVQLLDEEYRIVQREHHTWPFRTGALGRYFFTTALPLILSLISIYLEYLAVRH